MGTASPTPVREMSSSHTGDDSHASPDCDADSLARKIAYAALIWGGGTPEGLAEAEQILASTAVLS